MSSWYIEDSEERARVRAAALPELDAASDDLQRYFMHQMARIHRLTAEVCDLRQERAKQDALREALEALVDAQPYLHPWPSSVKREEWKELQDRALDLAAAALESSE